MRQERKSPIVRPICFAKLKAYLLMISKTFAASRFAVSAIAAGAVFCVTIAATPATVSAQQLGRVWVDASGRYSVEASLVRVTEGEEFVVLRRADGGNVMLTIDQLSLEDQEFIDNHLHQIVDGNRLRQEPPQPPEHEALPVFKLSSTVDQANESIKPLGRIEMQSSKIVRPLRSLPIAMEADASPWSLGCLDSVIPIQEINFSDEASEPIPIVVTDDWQTRETSVAVSLSGHSLIPGQPTRQQLLRFDLGDQTSVIAMQSKRRVRLMDHHIGSGRSLLLTGQGTMGEGGSISIAEGWNDDNIREICRQALPGSSGSEQSSMMSQGMISPGTGSTSGQAPPKLLWAKMVDQQHVIAQLKGSIVLWNLISGDTVFRIDHVDPRSEPAISDGRRYLAVPTSGAVDLYAIESGKPLGRIKVERQIPGVSFSPYGDALAIVTSRRLRVWNFVDAALDSDTTSRESFGQGSPTWIDHDMLLSSSGILISQFRGLPIWKYDLAGAKVTRVGKHIAIVRKEPWSQLATMQLPHPSAKLVLKQLDSTLTNIDDSDWRIPGRSTWDGGEWIDRVQRIAESRRSRR